MHKVRCFCRSSDPSWYFSLKVEESILLAGRGLHHMQQSWMLGQAFPLWQSLSYKSFLLYSFPSIFMLYLSILRTDSNSCLSYIQAAVVGLLCVTIHSSVGRGNTENLGSSEASLRSSVPSCAACLFHINIPLGGTNRAPYRVKQSHTTTCRRQLTCLQVCATSHFP